MNKELIREALEKIIERSRKHLTSTSHHKCDYLDALNSNFDIARKALASLDDAIDKNVKEIIFDIFRLAISTSVEEACKTGSDLIETLIDTRIETAKNKWISVTERLPKEFQNVLVYDISGDMYKSSYRDYGYGKPTWTDYSDQEHSEDITHWMNLPEPPKGEKQDDNKNDKRDRKVL